MAEKTDDNNGAKRTFRERRHASSEPADWSSVDGRAIAWAVHTISQNGGALRLGLTSDGGAYAIGVYGDGEPYTEYLKPSDNVEEYLAQLAGYFDEQIRQGGGNHRSGKKRGNGR